MIILSRKTNRGFIIIFFKKVTNFKSIELHFPILLIQYFVRNQQFANKIKVAVLAQILFHLQGNQGYYFLLVLFLKLEYIRIVPLILSIQNLILFFKKK